MFKLNNFKLSEFSLENLSGVVKPLRALLYIGIDRTPIDFAVLAGVKTIETQRENVKSGASQTMNSKHLDGRAVDLRAYKQGKGTWEPDVYYELLDCLIEIATNVELPIRWGGAWHIPDITKYNGTAEEASREYIELRKSQGREPFVDLPHIEVSW